MNKKLILIGIIFLITAVFIRLAINIYSNLKLAEFKPASVVFMIDTSKSNQKTIEEQKKYLKQLCSVLDPEDTIKILSISREPYLIFEGSPFETSSINNALNSYTSENSKYDNEKFWESYRKAFGYSLLMLKSEYIPSIVVFSDLEVSDETDYKTLAKNIKKLQKFAPEFSMVFLYAHPEKLDKVKEDLAPVLGENKLVLASDKTLNKVQQKFITALGR